MPKWHLWILWLFSALYAAPVFWRAAGGGVYPLAGQRGLVTDLSIGVPVALLVLSAALVLTIKRWRNMENCFTIGGALIVTSFALLMYVHDSAGLGLVVCATLLGFETRRQHNVLLAP
jgi:hypothetical protein